MSSAQAAPLCCVSPGQEQGLAVLPTRASLRFGMCLAGGEQQNQPTLLRCAHQGCDFSSGEGWCCPFCSFLGPAEVPSCWRLQDVVPACCAPAVGAALASLWELLGLTCTERGGKKMEVFFIFPFFLIFCYFAGSLSTEQSLCAGWPELFQEPFPRECAVCY